MSVSIKIEPVGKSVLRSFWRLIQLFRVLTSTFSSGRVGPARLFFGGARPGDLGGPYVKVKRLSEHFPVSPWNYNLVYLLSNSPYLSRSSIRLLKAKHIPIVLNQNGVFYPGWYGGNWEKKNTEMAVAYHEADYVLWQSDFCRQAADRFLGVREGPGETLMNGVDTRRFFRPSLIRPARPFTFLLTGRIDAHMAYRVESSIAGLRAARDSGLDCRLIVAGWINDAAYIRSASLAKKLGIANNIIFTGAYTQMEAPAIYKSADAYLMMKYQDPCPNTVLEAMACGLPIVYSASGGVPQQVGPDAGVGLYVPENWGQATHTPCPVDIGDAMIKVSKNAPIMSAAARSRAENMFDLAIWLDRHRAIFKELLEMRD